MVKANTNSKQGFTIIEVVLVLAIAGLIFLMVFVALPALQRSQRDTQRRNDLSRVDTSLVQYQTNNQGTGNGNLPTSGTYVGSSAFDDSTCKTSTACLFVRNYMNSGTSDNIYTNTFQDPDGTYYGMKIMSQTDIPADPGWSYQNNSGAGSAMNHIIYIFPGAKCNGEYVVKDTERHFAIAYRLEGAGSYCIDDQ